MSDTWDIKGLLEGLGTDLGPFTVKAVIPDEGDSQLFYCHIRSSTFRKVYDIPEYDMGISVCHDPEQKLIGFFMRVQLDIPGEQLGFALTTLNDAVSDEVMLFSQMSLSVVEGDDEDETMLWLECAYHLSTVRHLPTHAQHLKLMSAMCRDAMKRLYTETHFMADELVGAYREYLETPKN